MMPEFSQPTTIPTATALPYTGYDVTYWNHVCHINVSITELKARLLNVFINEIRSMEIAEISGDRGYLTR